MNHLGEYDVIVIGAGHAGIEAAHAAATLGARTAVFTMSLDAIGNMPCNPSIGGTAKGTLVRELDALGGVMGLAADATYLQSRMLNKGKGPAVHALRVQTDRKRYHEYMKHALELTPGLAIHQAEVVGLEVENGRVKGIVTQLNGEYTAKCVVLATGTNLGGKIFVGDAWYASGPDGMHAANALTESLKAAGLPLRRFKTGTPARVHRRSGRPAAFRLSVRALAACIPSGPEAYHASPTKILPPRFVPVASTTHFAVYSPSSWVITPFTRPSSTSSATTSA